MMRGIARTAGVLVLGLLGVGCGKGLTVHLQAVPDPANPGQSVKWTLSVHNDTQCDTTEDMNGSSGPIPTEGAFAIIIGFVPQLDGPGAAAFCRELTAMSSECSDQSCLTAFLDKALGPQLAGALEAQIGTAIQQVQGPQPASACETIMDNSSGFIAVCAVDPIGSGQTQIVMHSDTAPDTGSHEAAQVALAFAPARGNDCRPGTDVGDDLWALAGCYPPTAINPAPVLSPIAAGGGAALLLLIGVAGLRRKRKP